MLFTSPVFLLFMLAVLVVARLPLKWGVHKAFLLLASYYFYASWNPPFVFLLATSTIVDFVAALAMARAQSVAIRRLLLVLSLSVNLGLLGAFKYAYFFADSAYVVSAWAGYGLPPPTWSLVLPVGISFYTFQTLSYTIDVYRGKLSPTRSFVDFALFVSFFPQLVAGPIVRASEFLPQLQTHRKASWPELGWASLLFIVGLFKKVFLADSVFAPVADTVYRADAKINLFEAWVGTYAFAGQIFCDFSGYTDMAIGCAIMLGFRLPTNFRSPYAALGFSDFWRRWHISLSSWLRDYLYIPLGGNRKGLVRTQFNLAITMLLGGLWHGANWTFVIWGGLHGIYLACERAIRRLAGDRCKPGRVVTVLLVVLTFHLVCLAWVFFRAESLSHAMAVLAAMAGLRDGGAEVGRWPALIVLGAMGLMLSVQMLLREKDLGQYITRIGWKLPALAAGVMLFLVLTAGGKGGAFIYFQF